ncbi:MAG TPA: hypothetical protein PLC04_00355 [Candidatus Kapabacteria bacterium]|nr:hypothetical protein [Candidatus Kapabacteria bacterium]
MKKIYILIAFSITFQSCQLIVIQPKNKVKTVIIANQAAPQYVLNLYLMNLDSNKVYEALFLQSDTLGRKLLPIQQWETYDDVSRLQRQIGLKPITAIKFDTLSDNLVLMNVEFDYIRKALFLASKIDTSWFISCKASWKEVYYLNNLTQ